MNEQELYRIVAGVVNGMLAASPTPAAAAGDRIPVEISAKHVHLSQEHVEALFGPGYTLTPKRDLSQPGQFLCEERVTVIGPKGTFKNVAVLGPVRSRTQVELSATDARTLGVKAPLRLSGDLAGCPGVFIQAGDAMVRADESVMVAQNHIHMTPADAQRLGVHDGEVVSVRMDTERPLTFDHVLVRATDTSALAMHPVSYTHLDVYKRQATYWPAWRPRPTPTACAGTCVLARLDERVARAIRGTRFTTEVNAAGIVECSAVETCVHAADTAVKAADVELVRLRLGGGIGGKGYLVLTGDVAAVSASVEAASAVAADASRLIDAVVIPRPDEALFQSL
ncbi:phosphate propanoyltransferase [Collinsella ihumii]|uniref:phosphate propanoyltransferase n=1 Tax=Collinsella ihumii TaxID=1720204 RepID=UPI000834B2DA|nr:phosphate propanoyltransferase [Collinsella ihumii]